VIDNGGSLCIHTFGAVFGLAVSAIIFCNEEEFMRINNNPHITSNYLSNMFAFIGSIFLWLFFPSFNVANIQMKEFSSIYTDTGLGYISENMRYRGIINTYLSMMGSVLSAFIVSPLFYKGKMKIEHILHASYVGGIIIGGCCTICSSAWAAVVIGIVGSTVTIIFLWKIKKLLHSVKFQDTIGVLAIFAIPGFLGGITTAIFAGNFDNNNAWNDGSLNAIFGRSNNKTGIYAGLQIAGIFISLGIAAFSGLITGLLARVMVCTKNRYYFVDSEYFVEEIGVVFPEYIYGDEKENNLNSSGNKLNLDGREVNINNNPNLQNNNKNNIDNNNVSEEENSSNNNLK
jgi:ammonium transporter Rh